MSENEKQYFFKELNNSLCRINFIDILKGIGIILAII